MIKLNFKIDNDFLIGYILKYSNPDSKKLIPGKDHSSLSNFQEVAWRLDQSSYFFIAQGFSLQDLTEHSLSKKAILAEDFLKKCANLPEFKNVLQETQDALEKVKSEWAKNFTRSSVEIENIIGYSPDGAFDVLITHPSLSHGRNMNGTIGWTYRNDFENYNTIYLWHEILHSFFGKSTIEHALIELITDNELRAHFNNIIYPPFEGHPYLQEMKEKILPEWKEYLSRKNKNIQDFKDELLKKYL